jgi:hypothetical protein
MFHVDGRMDRDRHDKAVTFCNFANVPENDTNISQGFRQYSKTAEIPVTTPATKDFTTILLH